MTATRPAMLKAQRGARGLPDYHCWSLEQLICGCAQLPPNIRRDVYRNACGVWTHELYFDCMTPNQTAPHPCGRARPGHRQMLLLIRPLPRRFHTDCGRALRLRVGMARVRAGRRPARLFHTQSGYAAHPRASPHPVRRRMGARILFKIYEPARRLSRRMVAYCRLAVRRGKLHI